MRRCLLSVAALWVVAGVLAACDGGAEDRGGSARASVPSDIAPASDRTTPSGDGQPTLEESLERIGVDRSNAPTLAVTLDGASYCGLEDLTEGRLDAGVRQCFEDAHLDQRAALFVSYAPTNEGDPVAMIYRTSEGVATFYTDQTRDPFGSGQWESGSCADVTIASGPPPESAPVFTCAG